MSAAAILAITGLVKLRGVSGPSRVFAAVDPVTGLSFGRLLLAVGLVELAIAGVCLFGRSREMALWLVAWLATSFLAYRLGLWWMGGGATCPCLGDTSALHISPWLADNIAKVLLAYLLIGSYGLLARGWWSPGTKTRSARA